MRASENISVFYDKQCMYNPQMTDDGAEKGRERLRKKGNKPRQCSGITNDFISKDKSHFSADKLRYSYPKNIISLSQKKSRLNHPTQKPVELMAYLIKTYTKEGETVLDFTMGSGSTGVAAVNTNRKFIGIEMDDKYFDIAQERIEDAKMDVLNLILNKQRT